MAGGTAKININKKERVRKQGKRETTRRVGNSKRRSVLYRGKMRLGTYSKQGRITP